MSILTDREILARCQGLEPMIKPFEQQQIREFAGQKQISFGLSSMGYDLRLAGDEFRVFSPVQSQQIDPKQFDQKSLITAPSHQNFNFEQELNSWFLIPPHSYALGLTLEEFSIPEDVLGICVGKSTYARCGLVVNTTPLEPGWKGRLVLELANTASLPVRVYIGEGIAQCLFWRADERPMVTYRDRSGKYQGQAGLVTARV